MILPLKQNHDSVIRNSTVDTLGVGLQPPHGVGPAGRQPLNAGLVCMIPSIMAIAAALDRVSFPLKSEKTPRSVYRSDIDIPCQADGP